VRKVDRHASRGPHHPAGAHPRRAVNVTIRPDVGRQDVSSESRRNVGFDVLKGETLLSVSLGGFLTFSLDLAVYLVACFEVTYEPEVIA